MFQSPIDNENGDLKTDLPVNFKLTHFNLKGSHLEIEGYASIKGIFSYSEDKIRKTLLLRQEINIEKFREETKFDDNLKDLTDQEIVDMHTIVIPINNAKGVD